MSEGSHLQSQAEFMEDRYVPWIPHAEVIQVIRVSFNRGCGKTYCTEPHDHENIRRAHRYYSLDGKLLAEDDSNNV